MHSSLASFAVALSYGLTCGAVVFLAGLKMIGEDDRAELRERVAR